LALAGQGADASRLFRPATNNRTASLIARSIQLSIHLNILEKCGQETRISSKCTALRSLLAADCRTIPFSNEADIDNF
jgi:hypothetical protein